MNLNITFIAGNITHSPETRATESGTKITSFTVATNRFYKDNAGKCQEESEFHNVQAFGKLAETCAQYLVKGQQVLVEGRLQTRRWKTQDGQPRHRTEIIANTVKFGTKPDGAVTTGDAAEPGGTGGNVTGEPGGAGGNIRRASKQEKVSYPEEDIRPEDIPF